MFTLMQDTGYRIQTSVHNDTDYDSWAETVNGSQVLGGEEYSRREGEETK